MLKQYIKATLIKGESDLPTFVASDETLDRSGEVLPIQSWDLANFKENPVLLVNHDYKVENIVGAAKNIRVKDTQLIFDAMFHDITEKAREVKKMVEQGFLNTVSVGFMTHGPKKDGDQPSNELFEISFVPVPANPSASRLKALIDKAAETEKIKEIEAWLKQNETTEVQSVICSKDTFDSPEAAAKWCADHDFKSDKVDETGQSYRFRQFDPAMCQTDSERTIDITDGVKAVVCRKKKEAAETETKGAIPYKDLGKAPEDEAWDGAAEVADASVEDLKMMCAWVDPENVDVKQGYKLPHHHANGGHVAVWKGVAAAMAALLGGRGGVNIPDGDRKAVYNHLAKHYAEFEKEPPEFREAGDIETKEGRVLSEKNRSLIASTVDILRKSISALDDLLSATETAKSEGTDDQGRDPKVVRVYSEPDAGADKVVRALQSIVKTANTTLAATKKIKKSA